MDQNIVKTETEMLVEDFGEDEGEDDEIEGENEPKTDLPVETPTKLIPATSDTQLPPSRKRKRAKVPICTSACRYEVVRRCAKQLNMKEVGEDDDWLLYWTDCSVSLDRVMNMKRYQRINHFPGMSEICRKDFLARNMNRLYKAFPKDYNIFPKSWVLPADNGDFQNFIRTKKNKCYITKPETGCQGKGIYITKNPTKDINITEHQVVQQYISRPLLMDGMKFDLRVYVLVSSIDPLRIYVFNEGLVRLATVNYTDPTTSNTDEVCMHLTNYAINKHNDNFVRPTGAQDPEDSADASKRSFAFFRKWLDEQGLPKEQVFKDMNDLVIKTIITAHPILYHNYKTCFPQPWKASSCFEILGFDVLFDRKLKPWLLEVNHSPSFHTDSKLDKEIKTALIRDTLTLLDLRLADRRKCLEEDKKRIQARLTQPKSETKEQKNERIKTQTDEWLKQVEKFEQRHVGGYERIYPPAEPVEAEKYAKFFNSSASLFQTTATQRAREDAARIQLEEIRLKNLVEQAKRQGKPIPDLTGGKRGESAKSGSEGNLSLNRIKNSGSKSRLYSGKNRRKEVVVNIMIANPINDVDENERKFQLRQRNAQIKSLGIPDLVQKLVTVIKSRDRTVDRAIDSMGRLTTGEPGAIGVVDKLLDRYAIQPQAARPLIQPKHFIGDSTDNSRNKDPILATIEKLQAHYRVQYPDHKPRTSKITSRTMSLTRQEIASPKLFLKHPKSDQPNLMIGGGKIVLQGFGIKSKAVGTFDFKQSRVLNRYQPAKNSQRQIDTSSSRSTFITKLLGPIIARPGTAEKI